MKKKTLHQSLKDQTYYGPNKKITVGKGTATRRGSRLLYSTIPWESLESIAKRFTDGAEIHGINNWKDNMPIHVIIDHMIEHLKKWSLGDTSDDHLSAIAWGSCALIWYSIHKPEMVEEYRKRCA